MEVITVGHRYALDNLEGGEPQVLQFIQKEPVSEGSTELKTIVNGTTNEEVLAMLIDRMEFLQEILPCDENEQILRNLRESLSLVEKRAAERQARGVRGTNQA